MLICPSSAAGRRCGRHWLTVCNRLRSCPVGDTCGVEEETVICILCILLPRLGPFTAGELQATFYAKDSCERVLLLSLTNQQRWWNVRRFLLRERSFSVVGSWTCVHLLHTGRRSLLLLLLLFSRRLSYRYNLQSILLVLFTPN